MELVSSVYVVILIHHCGKDAARGARGWSGLRAATDTELEVTDMHDGYFQVRPTKQRDYTIGLPLRYRLKVVEIDEDEDGEVVTTCVVEPTGAGEIATTMRRGRVDERASMLRSCMDSLLAADKGRPIPPDTHELSESEILPGSLALSVPEVRSFFCERFDEAEGERDSLRDTPKDPTAKKRQSFRRAKLTLIKDEIISTCGDWMWIR